MNINKDYGVVVAKSAGFCPGVKKAIDKVMALEASGKKPIYTLGPLIHNKQVAETLEAKGIQAIDSLQEVKDKAGVLVIRAHGITPEFQKQIEDTKMEVCDATCPLVKHAHNIIKKYADLGYSTVIVGDAGHAEVTGLLGYAKGNGHVVSGLEESKNLPYFTKVNIVAQTTQKETVFLETADFIKNNSKEAIISNTICEPTRQRQSETVDMAKASDLVIVVGGKHSANTARLAMLCSTLAPRTLHIESERDLEKEDIIIPKNIFITAGASTPNWVIDNVSVWVKKARKPKSSGLVNALERAWVLFVGSSLYASLGASALTYVSMQLQGVRANWELFILSSSFVFSLTVFNRGLAKHPRDRAFKKYLIASIISGILATFTAFMQNLQIGLLTTFFWGLGIVYSSKKLPSYTPAAKDIVTSCGWAFVCVYIPAAMQGLLLTKPNQYALCYAVLLVFARSIMLGVGSAQKDIIIGKESFYKAFGLRVTVLTVFLIIAALTGALIMLFSLGWKTGLVSMLLVGNIYITFVALHVFTKHKPQNILEETLIEGQFFVLSVLAYTSRFL